MGGRTERTKIRPGPGAGGQVGRGVEGVEPRLHGAVVGGRPRGRPGQAGAAASSLAMAADLLVQLAGDLGGERAHARRLDGPRLRDVDLPLPDDAAGPRAQQHDPLAEPGGLAHVVRDEHDRQPLLAPRPG